MGSSSSRRKKDHVSVAPQEPRRSSGSGGGSGNGNAPMTCPLTFKIPLVGNPAIGAALHLKFEGDDLNVYLGGEKISTVSKALAQTIRACVDSGYRYEGVVAKEKSGKRYGQFKRTA